MEYTTPHLIEVSLYKEVITLTPFVPLSLEGEGEGILKRGADAPLKHPLLQHWLYA